MSNVYLYIITNARVILGYFRNEKGRELIKKMTNEILIPFSFFTRLLLLYEIDFKPNITKKTNPIHDILLVINLNHVLWKSEACYFWHRKK